MKKQFMVDFLTKFVGNNQTNLDWWSLYVDNVSNVKVSGAGITLEGPDNVILEQALKLNFKALNDQVEYEAFIAGLKPTREVGAKKLRYYTNSQLVQGQVANRYQTKENVLLKYYHITKNLIDNFKCFEM